MLSNLHKYIAGVMTVLVMTVIASTGHAKTNKKNRSAKKSTTRPTVAVLYFDYAGNDPDMAVLKKGLANMLITDLVSVDGLQVVERGRLQELVGELKLNKSRTIDRRKAVQIGKMAGALYIVVGHYLTFGQKLLIEARLLNTATSIYVGKFKARVLGTADDFFELQQQLSHQLQTKLTETLPSLATFASNKRFTAPRKPSSVLPPHKIAAPSRITLRPSIKSVQSADTNDDGAASSDDSVSGAGGGSASGGSAGPMAKMRLPYKLALLYAKALDCKDRGDMKGARTNLQNLLKQAPGFTLARSDLEKLK